MDLDDNSIMTIGSGFNMATGIVIVEDYIYVTDSRGVSAIPYDEDNDVYSTPLLMSLGTYTNIKGITYFSSALYIFSSFSVAFALLLSMVSF